MNLVRKKMYKKYSRNLKKNYDLSVMNNILEKDKCHIVAIFKEFLLYYDYMEFLKRFYKITESRSRLINISYFYKENLLFFPNYSPLIESRYLHHNIRRKQALKNKIINNKKKMQKMKKNQKDDEKEDEKINKKYKIEKKKIIDMNSLIIDNDEEYYINLKNWINPNSDIKFKLLYRLSRDGKGFQTFHNLCDNKGMTLSLFKLYDGNILGGYTTKDWDDSNSWKKDENAFVFSLTENVKCEVNKNNNYKSIYCNKRCGPFFEPLKFNSNKMDELYFYESNYYNEINKLYPGKSHNYYKVQEVEIFKIEFN